MTNDQWPMTNDQWPIRELLFRGFRPVPRPRRQLIAPHFRQRQHVASAVLVRTDPDGDRAGSIRGFVPDAHRAAASAAVQLPGERLRAPIGWRIVRGHEPHASRAHFDV